MSRLRRLHLNHRIFFVTTHFSKSVLPISNLERGIVLNALNECHKRRCFLLFSYVVMPTHLHLLIGPKGEDTIAAVMRDFKLTAAKRINEARERDGAIWQRRYFDRIMRHRREWSETVEYIHTNPVKDGLAAKPDDWPWSSWHAFIGNGRAPIPVDFVDMPIDERAWLRV